MSKKLSRKAKKQRRSAVELKSWNCNSARLMRWLMLRLNHFLQKWLHKQLKSRLSLLFWKGHSKITSSCESLFTRYPNQTINQHSSRENIVNSWNSWSVSMKSSSLSMKKQSVRPLARRMSAFKDWTALSRATVKRGIVAYYKLRNGSTDICISIAWDGVYDLHLIIRR